MSTLLKVLIFGAIFLAIRVFLRSLTAGRKQREPAARKRRQEEKLIRQPPPFDARGWPEFAASIGLGYSLEEEPRICGTYRDMKVEILTGREAIGATCVLVALPTPARARLAVYRANSAERGEDLVATGDREFDAEFITVCRWPSFARQVLSGQTKTWLMALGDAELTVTTGRVAVSTEQCETASDRLRALLELAVEAASHIDD